MHVASLLDQVFLHPLELIYTWISLRLFASTESIPLTLVGLSIVLNLILLPVYYQMETAGRSSAKLQEEVDREVARMKAHFKGRERYYYIKAVHRQFGYRPLSSVLRSGDLFLQILIFATVFRFIADQPFAIHGPLSTPDGALFGLNLLPIVMTLASVASAFVYDSDAKRRKQALFLAVLFLILLYSSPAALVLYWTSNSVFSLVRNLVKRGFSSMAPSQVSKDLAQLAIQE